jgi:AcrR family transcriptional regulator
VASRARGSGASTSQGGTDQAPEPTRRKRGRPRLDGPSPDYVRRQEEIIGTAARVFHERGYESGSLDDVAAALDLRKASLYYYVESKAHLLYLIFDRAISMALQRLDELAEIDDARERLAAFIAHQVSLVATERNLFSVFFDSRPRLEATYEKRILTKERAYMHRFVDAVGNAVDAGVIAKVDSRHGAQAILGMTSWLYKWYDPAKDDVTRLSDDLIAMVITGPVKAGPVKAQRRRKPASTSRTPTSSPK